HAACVAVEQENRTECRGHRRTYHAGTAAQGPHRRQGAALPGGRAAVFLCHRRSGMHSRRPEKAAACSRRFQRLTGPADPTARVRAGTGRSGRTGESAACGWTARRAESSARRTAPATGGRSVGTIRRPRHAIGVPSSLQATGPCGAHTMKVVAVYNLKGGVGKTTTAVNLSYLAAASSQRVLLWDL